MFKNRILLIAVFLCISFLIPAQNRDTEKRTSATTIADLLAQMPAASAARMDDLMQEMAAFSESDLISITGMLNAPGKGDDSQVRFAISGFSNFVMREGKAENRRLCLSAWCKALDQANDKEIKAFMISQLQITGTSETVPCLVPYLNDQRLCDPAARALVVINSPGAGEALLKAMNSAQGQQLGSLAQALGDIRNVSAVESLTKLLNSKDLNTRKAAMYALGNIGAGESGKLLYHEAKIAGFTYEPSRAVSSYLLWLDHTGENGNTGVLKKETGSLIKECQSDNQVHTRTEALALLVKYTGEKSLPGLLAAADEPNSEYRNAALRLSNSLTGEKVTTAWIKKAGKLKDQAKADVITMLGNRGDQAAFTTVVNSLSDPSKQVRMAAVSSAKELGEGNALPYLLEFIKKSDPEEILIVKQSMLSMHGENVVSGIAAAIPTMTEQAKITLIEVVAARAGFNEKDLPYLNKLLVEAGRPDDIAALQKAILSALQGIKSNDAKSEVVFQEMNKIKGSQQARYYKILSDIGGNSALAMVKKSFSEGTPEIKNAAFKALSDWKDASPCDDLYAIITEKKDNYADSAFTAYVKLVNISGYPDDQKILLLRKVMDISKTTEQKRLILESLEKTRSFTALVFAGRYLDDRLLQGDAANTVMHIGLADTTYFGKVTAYLLTRAMGKLKGSESDYNREAISKYLASRPAIPGFLPLFNGRDLTGWKGLVENPVLRAKMSPKELEKKQVMADEIMRKGWYVQDDVLMFNGNGENLCTTKPYGDFEMLVDWKITPNGDAGIYLRGSPQVQIWDASRLDTDAKVGSGGLYNNIVNEKSPLRVADNPVGEWNTFRIKMVGERVTVYLNGQLVVDNTIMENYWDRSIPIFPAEQIELQAHGSLLAYRDIYVRELPRPEPYQITPEEKSAGFKELFDGMSLFSWIGNTKDYQVENGDIVFHPNNGGSGNLYTRDEYGNFILRFDFQLTPAGNSGIGIRAPLTGDAAYVGMEIQVLDDDADVYRNLQPYQYHGSVYGVIPAKRGYLKPLGEWNSEEIMIQGNKIRVTLNSMVIVDGDIAEASRNGTLDHKDHPGLKNSKGHIGFLSHDSLVKFRNIRIKSLD
jgi:HEAT repeat protein